jgi:hypothetical protein
MITLDCRLIRRVQIGINIIRLKNKQKKKSDYDVKTWKTEETLCSLFTVRN